MGRRVATPAQLYRLNKAGALQLNPYVITDVGEEGEIGFPLASSAIAELAGCCGDPGDCVDCSASGGTQAARKD